MLNRLSRSEKHTAVTTTKVPAALPEHERRQLAKAQVRIPKKWAEFDRMIAEHAKVETFFGGRR